MKTKMPSGMIRDREAAKFLNYTVATLKKWRVQGKGPAYFKGRGGSVWYRKDELKAYLEKSVLVRVEPKVERKTA